MHGLRSVVVESLLIKLLLLRNQSVREAEVNSLEPEQLDLTVPGEERTCGNESGSEQDSGLWPAS
jgi:hypothetical protein